VTKLHDDGQHAYIDDGNRNHFSFNFFVVAGQDYQLFHRVDGWYGLYDAGHRMVALIEPGFEDFESPAFVDHQAMTDTLRTLKLLVDERDEMWRLRREKSERD
jgi:hypothetical protein